MSKSMKINCLTGAVVATAAVLSCLSTAGAAPFLHVRLVDELGNSAISVNRDQVVNYQVQVRVADVGATNNTLPRTISSLVAGTDGFGSVRVDLKGNPLDGIQADFAGPAALQAGLGAGLGASGGSSVERTHGWSNLLGLAGVVNFGMPYLGVPANDTTEWLTVATGQFTVRTTGVNSTVMPGFWLISEGGSNSASSFKYNNGSVLSLLQSASDPYLGF